MRTRAVIGVLLVLGSFAQVGMSWHLSRIAADNGKLALSAWAKADRLCRDAVDSLGQVAERGEEILVTRSLSTGEDWRVALMDVSSVVSHCSTRRMTYFCMGRACGEFSDPTAALSNLENQAITPTASEILGREPVKISLRLQEVRS